MNKFYRVLLWTFLYASFATAQEAPKINIIPPSPTAAALGKYGEVPVSPFTGVPNIGIPLYEVKGRSLSLPISLSYHASGLKVEEVASWVGLGWSLNAGGMITRTVRGRPDDENYFYNNLDLSQSGQNLTADQLKMIVAGTLDSEPDVFYFNFAGYSGRLVFTGSNQGELLFTVSPYAKMKVRVYTSFAKITAWDITTDDGTTYSFGNGDAKETSLTENGDGNAPCIQTWYLTKITAPDKTDEITLEYTPEHAVEYHSFSSETLWLSNNAPQPGQSCTAPPKMMSKSYTTVQARKLSRIAFTGGEVLFGSSFGREDYGNDKKLDDILVKDAAGNEIKYFSFKYNYFGGGDAFGKRLKLAEVQECGGSDCQTKNPPYLFEYYAGNMPSVKSYAQDHWGFYNGKKDNKTLIPKDLYNIPYEGADREATTDIVLARTSVLKKITYPTGGSSEFLYEPNDYYDPYQSPPGQYALKSVSLGGAYHFKTEQMTGGGIKKFTVGNAENAKISYSFILTPKTPKPLSEVSAKVALKKNGVEVWKRTAICLVPSTPGSESINLPAGEYELEVTFPYVLTCCNEDKIYSASIGLDYEGYVECSKEMAVIPSAPCGGVRIKEIKDFDGKNSTVRRYDYWTPMGCGGQQKLISTGRLGFKPDYKYTMIQWKDIPPQPGQNYSPCQDYACMYDVLTSHSQAPLGTISGNHVQYPLVTEWYGPVDADLTKARGKTEYRFTYLSTYSTGFPFAPNTNEEFKAGLPTLTSHYEYNAVLGKFFVKKEVENEYVFYDYPGAPNKVELPALKVQKKIFGMTCPDNDKKDYWVQPYNVISEWYRLAKTTERMYESADPAKYAETFTEYFHDNPAHIQPTRLITRDEKGDTLLTRMRYPADFADGQGNEAAAALTTLKQKHMHGALIEKHIAVLRQGQEVPLSAELTLYKNFGNLTLPHRTLQAGGNTLPDNFKPALVQNGAFTFDPSYREVLSYLAYNAFSQPTALRTGEKTLRAYGWNYQKTLPVSEFTHVDAEASAYTSFEADDTGGWTFDPNGLQPTGKTGLRSYQGSVSKNGLPKGTYLLSLWAKGGGVSVNGQLKNAGPDWTLLTWLLKDVQSVSLQTGTTFVDELLLLPAEAAGSGYTYTPLLGHTSGSDAKGNLLLYEYDEFGRLKSVDNGFGEKKEHIDYHYQEKP